MYVTRYVPNTDYAHSSVMSLASYLEKEALIQEKLSGSARQLSAYLDKQNDVVRVDGHEYFFNGTGTTYDSEDVTKAIDTNAKGLKKSEARYYAFTISPSSQEIVHLRRMIADTKSALQDAGELVPEGYEDDLLRGYLKEYGVHCMDAYAQNFGHPEISSNRDLLWFGMVEKERYWKKSDKEVQINADLDRKIRKLTQRLELPYADKPMLQHEIAALQKKYIRECQVRQGGSEEILRPMMAKAGDNWHIHVTVSRHDITNSISLSPKANGRGSKNHLLNGQSVRVGFDRENYKIRCEKLFDATFAHERLQTESYEKAKELRAESAFVFEKQRIRDLETRRAENLEYSRLKVEGYNAYFENLKQSERLDARHLAQIKRHAVRQIRQIYPQVDTKELISQDLEELQSRFGQMDMENEMPLNPRLDGLAAQTGDYVLSATGLPISRPFSTVRKVLRKGIMLNKALDRRREMYDRWFDIYRDTWYRENYLFDSIAERRNMECFLAQTEALEEQFTESILLRNAHDYLSKIEQQFVTDFLKESWPEHLQDQIGPYAVELFGRDGESVRTLGDFDAMATERLLPNDAAACMKEAAKRCERPRSVADLRKQLEALRPERVARLEQFTAERGERLKALRELLNDNNLTTAAKEEALMRLAREDKLLDKALRDLRKGVVKILEQQNPGIANDKLKDMLDKIFGKLQDVKLTRQEELNAVVDEHIRNSIPDYFLIVDKQSELEQLLRDITPDKEKYADRMIEANNFIRARLSPHAEQLFEQHSRRLFGVSLRNEHDFAAYVDKNYSVSEAQQLKNNLKTLYARIEARRATIIQEYVKQIPSKHLETVCRQQNYINRYINRNFGAGVAKSKREDLQRTMAGACRRIVTPKPQYKVLNPVALKRISVMAMAKASLVKITTITPQQVVFKAAFKLIGVLTKGY